MKLTINRNDKKYIINTSHPIDISIQLQSGKQNPNAWYIDPPIIKPESEEGWVGEVSKGASVNFNYINFNPHAHGTHTECVGHITSQKISIQDCLRESHFIAELVSVTPVNIGNDLQITKKLLQNFETQLIGKQAIIIRTTPNTDSKKTKQYNNTNWPYLAQEATKYIVELGIEHLLIDLPSVDKEKDDGKILAHKAFWQYPQNIRKNATITEFIYVPNEIKNGTYLLNLQIAPFANDASPSKPVLFHLINEV